MKSLEFKDVNKSFGSNRVLKNISFSVEQGEIVFILGTSGTGKSVLLKNIVGLMNPDSGQIFVEGTDVSQLSEDQYQSIRRTCGMVFQGPALFDSLTVFENVAFGLRQLKGITEAEIEAKVQHSLSLVGLKNIENHFPSQISYGMQKRVSLARTIAVEPRMLLFDEPTTGLDPVTTTSVNRLIQSLSKRLKVTSIVVSHDMKCAISIADRIIVLDRGEIIENATPEEILNSKQPLVMDFMSELKGGSPK